MEIHLRINFKRPGKKALLIYGGLAILMIAAWFIWRQASQKSSIPAQFRKQTSFKTVSAPAELVKADSYKYLADRKTLAFSVSFDGQKMAITEQPAPDNLTNGTDVYFQSLGLHPIAQFRSKAGPVAILNFYQSKTLAKVGTSGMLVASKTMVIANLSDPKASMSNEQWKKLFDSLKLDR